MNNNDVQALAREIVTAIAPGAAHEWRAHAETTIAAALHAERDRAPRPIAEDVREALSHLREAERHCPCGARPESPVTHPHVGGCHVYEAMRALGGVQ